MKHPDSTPEPEKNLLDFADPPFMLRAPEAGGFLHTNAAFLALAGLCHEELLAEPFLYWIEEEDKPTALAVIEGNRDKATIHHSVSGGESIPLEIRMEFGEAGPILLCRFPQTDVIPTGPTDEDDEATVSGTLHTIARIVEDQNPGYRCSILLVTDGRFVRGAGPSLPEEYNDAIDGFAVGPTIGSCGTAIYWNVPVIVEDIQACPLWAPFAELAGRAGVAACWSHPFTTKSGKVLGALALYSPVPRAPSKEQLSRLRAAARMTGLAVERGRAEEAFRNQRERELEEQLRQAAKMEALGVLAGGVAHDFNNILSTILGNAELAREMTQNNPEVRQMLTSIVEASQRAGQFCQQMLAYAGRGSLSHAPFEVGEILPKLTNLVGAAISKKTRVEYTLHNGPIMVEGDENQFLQVVMNLITNAAEAIGPEEGQIVVSTELAAMEAADLRALDPLAELPSGTYVRLTVQDNGPGMPAETAERIFDPFYTTKNTGRGLGLSAVKGIVQRHGGLILVDSTPGQGTTFTVVLPTTDRADSLGPATPDPTSGVGTRTILVADDDPGIRVILKRRLEKAGYRILLACDGQEALDQFEEKDADIDCALLDFSMPRLGGEEVQRELHARRPDLPIIIMSGFSEQEVVDRFREGQLAGILQKPFPHDAILDLISRALASS